MNDIELMQRAIRLARKGRGTTSPNPLVGSVIVKDGKIIGEGYHKRYGDKHAEIAAIESAKISAKGATLYCNLEPCSDTIPNKKTPPCINRIIQEKIKRVVISTFDPNPYVNGRGVQILRERGIQVDIGILTDESHRLNEKYFKYITTGLPFVHLKIAQSLDGRIATSTGRSQWITNQNAMKRVHQLRSEYDAVLVGVKTLIADDPLLTVRLVSGRNPIKIILDNELITPKNAKLLSDETATKTIIFTRTGINPKQIKNYQNKDVKILNVQTNGDGKLNLEDILRSLGKQQISSVLVEGGGEIFTSFIRAKLFDKISFFIAPLLIGKGIQSIGDLGIDNLNKAHKLKNVIFEIIDQQALVEGYREYNSSFKNWGS